ncbi:MAG: lipid-A-disaccharide synthase [Mariprofundaceae bacterium]|nr:lipid-A-disaccharide synthase [Mariprofundaceae bacterium]
MRILISAGEASGDMHAAAVIKNLNTGHNPPDTYGITGPAMKNAGCETLIDMEQLNVMGVNDVLKSLPRIRRVRNEILEWTTINKPDIAILVDFPGFHINLGKKLRKLGIPVLHYIAPKLWAWGAWRVKRLKQSQDKLACILPFEPEWFANHGIAAHYVGNPSAAACAQGWNRAEFRQRLGFSENIPVLAILPGSRPSELAHHVPLLTESWKIIQQQCPDVHCVVPLAPGVDATLLEPLIKEGAVTVDRMEEGFALRADAAIGVSGTATLELALWDVPTVLVYRTSRLTVFMAKKVVRIPYIGLANILLNEAVMPELIQEDATVEHIVQAALPLLHGKKEAIRQQEKFATLRTLLGDKNPAESIATIVFQMSSRSDKGCR